MLSLTPATRNKKLGHMATSISGKETCPDTCPLKENDECYGSLGPLSWTWKKITSGKCGVDWESFIFKVRALPRQYIFRMNQVGDLPGENLEIDQTKLALLVNAASHLRSYTYTHKPVCDSATVKGKPVKKSILKSNRAAIKEANSQGFTINLSCDNINQADEAVKLGIAPVVVVLPMNAPEKQVTPEGNKVVVCPAQTRGTTCANCMLCEKQRSVIVGFRAHGTKKESLNKRLTGAG